MRNERPYRLLTRPQQPALPEWPVITDGNVSIGFGFDPAVVRAHA